MMQKRLCNCSKCGSESKEIWKFLCRKCYMANYREANKEKLKQQSKLYRQNNPEKVKEWKYAWQKTERGREYNRKISKEWYHAGKTQESLKKYREANKEKTAARGKAWRQKYPEKHSRIQAKRRSLKHQAMPKMYSKKDDIWLENMFALCRVMEKRTGTKYHVDHIVPLKNKVVCGLHWIGNWAILPAQENLRKGNSLKEC